MKRIFLFVCLLLFMDWIGLLFVGNLTITMPVYISSVHQGGIKTQELPEHMKPVVLPVHSFLENRCFRNQVNCKDSYTGLQ